MKIPAALFPITIQTRSHRDCVEFIEEQQRLLASEIAEIISGATDSEKPHNMLRVSEMLEYLHEQCRAYSTRAGIACETVELSEVAP